MQKGAAPGTWYWDGAIERKQCSQYLQYEYETTSTVLERFYWYEYLQQCASTIGTGAYFRSIYFLFFIFTSVYDDCSSGVREVILLLVLSEQADDQCNQTHAGPHDGHNPSNGARKVETAGRLCCKSHSPQLLKKSQLGFRK